MILDRRCVFLGDETAVRSPRGHIIYVYRCRCNHPLCPWTCPSKGICSFFRIKSVMNSFDMEKENGGRRVL